MPEFNETSAVIARGRELVRKAHDTADSALKQGATSQALAERSEKVIDRAHNLLDGLDEG